MAFTDLHEISEMFSRLEGCADNYKNNGIHVFKTNEHRRPQLAECNKTYYLNSANRQRKYARDKESRVNRRFDPARERCAELGCDRPKLCKGLCEKHYDQSLRSSNPKVAEADRKHQAAYRARKKAEGLVYTGGAWVPRKRP